MQFLPSTLPVAAAAVSIVGAVEASAANAARRGMLVVNTSDTAMVVREGAVASALLGYPLAAGATYTVRSAGLVSVYCGVIDKTFSTLAW